MRAAAESPAGEQSAAVDRITVALVPKAAEDLARTIRRTGLSKTDIVNRAITLYEYVDARLSGGDELLVRNPATGQVEQIRFF
jgi:hypothetical protein